jgi:hypothetical protein
VFAGLERCTENVSLFAIAFLWSVDWLHRALSANLVAEQRALASALKNIDKNLATLGKSCHRQRIDRVEEALQPLRRLVSASPKKFNDSVRKTLTGDADHVLPYVLDRIYRERAALAATEAEDRIGPALEVTLRANLSRGITRPRNLDAIRKRLSRLKLSSGRPDGYRVACAKWDALLTRELSFQAATSPPQGSSGAACGQIRTDSRTPMSADRSPA